MSTPTSPPATSGGRVVVLAGPSGAGKSRLADRLARRHGWPVVRLDDFYRDGTDPGLPRRPGLDIPDWDDPASWDAAGAVAALLALCTEGAARMPVYDITTSCAVGERAVSLSPGGLVVAEGVFAAEVLPELAAAGLLHSAWCVRRPRAVTFALRLARDLGERRKPPLTLLRRGLLLARDEPGVVARQAALGAVLAGPRAAERRITAAVG